MGLAVKSATFMRKMRPPLTHFLTLVLVVSSLSAISVVSAPVARALTNADCGPTVGTAGSVTATAIDSDCVLVFSGDTTWTIPAGVTSIKFLLVGGGAAGRADGGGGGGGGGGLESTGTTVTPGTVANIDVGTGGSGDSQANGADTNLDINGTAGYEWVAKGGSIGTGWAYTNSIWAEGGVGGATGAQTGATNLTGGKGGSGPNGDAHTAPVNTGLGDGFTSSITGTTYYYGGGGSGGIGAHASGTNFDATYGGALGGKGGGGAGAKQLSTTDKASSTSISIGYRIDGTNQSSPLTLVAKCNNNSSYPHSTRGWPGLNGYGGGGGGGVAYGDGCSNGLTPNDDGERTAGGSGGNGVVIVRFTVPTLATPSTPDLVADSDTGISQTDNNTKDTTPTFTGTATAGSTIQLQIGSGTPVVYANTGATCLTDSSGVWTCTTGTLGTFLLSNSFRAVSTFNFGTSTTSSALVVTIIASSFSEPSSITRTNGSGTLGIGETASISFATSRGLYGFTADDLTVTGGTISNFVEVNARSFTATFTPLANAIGTGSISVGANKVSDQAGNTHTGSATFTIDYNTHPNCAAASTTSGGYTILTFTSTTTCNWSVPTGVTAADVLVVGGGGGGAGTYSTGTPGSGGGGGGGGAYLADAVPLTPSAKLQIKAGAGGAGGITTSSRPGSEGSQGGDSSFGTLTAGGGGGGGCATTSTNYVVCTNSSMSGRAGTAGGSGGGSTPPFNAYNWGAAGTGSSVTIGGKTFAGQTGYIGAIYNGAAGSGGGARSAATISAVGSGLSTDIAGGSAVEYGRGGRGSNQSGTSFNANTSGYGNGGDGAVVAAEPGAAGATGAQGVVIVKYINAPSITVSTSTINAIIGTAVTSYSITNSGGSVTSYSISPALSSNGTLAFSTSTGLLSGTPSSAASSTTYTITATNSSGSSTATFSFTSSASAVTPTIGTHPSNFARKVGESVTFSVAATASDSGSLSYQWQKGGVNISGATSSNYTFTPASTSDAGEYRVVVTNSKNSTTATSTSNVGKLAIAGTNNHRIFSRNTYTDVLSDGNSFKSSSAVIPTSGSFTIEGWFRENVTLDNQNPIFAQGTLSTGGFGVMVHTSPSRKFLFFDGNYSISPTTEITQGKWYHFALSYDRSASTMKLYLNGTEVGSITSYTPTLAGNFFLGNNNYYSSHFFHGQQDQFKIWTSSLTSSEIATSMHSYGDGGVSGKTLRTLYDFNQSTGSSMSDVLGGFDLTANGSGSKSDWASSSITVTFDEQGGSVVTDTTYDFYTKIADPGPITRTGYSFTGWSTTSNGSVISFPYIAPPLSAITLYAIWSVNSQTITYAAGTGGSGTAPTTPTAVNFGATFTTPANTYTRTGYTFAGWSDGTSTFAAGATYPSTGSVSGNVTLTATWTIITQTISYAAGTGGSGTAPTTPVSVAYGSTFTTPANTFTRAGYAFAGWSDGTGTYAAGATYPSTGTVTSNVTLTATWTAASNVVTFDANGGSSVVDGSFITGGALTKPTSPTKSKKIFGGWSTSETSNQGDLSNLIRSWPYSPSATSAITLYAIWNDDFSLTLAGTARTSAQIGTSASPVAVIPNNRSFTWEAWIKPTGFAGSGTTKWGNILNNGDDVNNFGRAWSDVVQDANGLYLSGGYYDTSGTGSMATSAANRISLNTWQHIAVSYERPAAAEGNCSGSGTLTIRLYINGVIMNTLTSSGFSGCLNSNGLIIGDNAIVANQQFKGQIDQVKIWDGVLTDTEIQSSRSSYIGTVDNTLRAHYGFNELISSPALNNVIRNQASDSSTYDLNVYGASSADVSSNLSRTQNSFQISYNGNSSTSGSVSAQTGLIPYEAVTISDAGNLVRTGYSFSGWNSLANGTGTSYSASTSVTSLYGDLTLYAQWTATNVAISTPSSGLTGAVGSAFSLSLVTSNGSGSGTFSLPSGSLPAGVTLNTSTGVISGTPTAAGTFAITARITDTNTTQATTTSFSIVISALKLSTPASLAANTISGAATAVTVTFNAVTNASSYTVQLFDSGGTKIGSDYTSFSSGTKISGLSAGTSYSVKVLAIGDGTNYTDSDLSTAASVTTLTANFLSLAGTTGQYASTANSVIPTSGNFTVEAWIAPTEYSGTRDVPTIISQGSGLNRIYIKLVSTGILTVLQDGGTAEIACSNSAIPLNIWTHIAVVKSSNTLSCYVNGTLQNNSPTSTLGSSTIGSGFYVGGYSAGQTATRSLFAGQIDEVKIWSSARTQSQIQNNMEVAPELSTANLVAYIPFDATTGTSAIDLKNSSNNLTLASTMTWLPLIRTVSYGAGTFGSGTSASQTSVSDHTTAITLKSAASASGISRTNYSISAWNTNAGGTSGTSYALSSSYLGATDLSLYPTWLGSSFTISYAAGTGGSGSAPTTPTSVNNGSTFTTPANTYTRSGYTFAGWNDGTNTYAASATYPVSGTVGANVTLTATWSANSLTVTYDSQGGSSVTSGSVATDAKLTAPTAPTRTGYTFAGWSTTSTGSVVSFTGGYTHGQTSSFTLYAIWSANSLTVTYDSQGGSSVTSGSVATDAKLTAPTAPTRTGYTFAGWSTTSTGSVVSFTGGYTHGQTASFTLYAIWTADTLTVTFNAKGGTSVANGSVAVGATLSAPTPPTKTGSYFSGWSTTDGGVTVSFPYTHGQTANFTLYAIWTVGVYSTNLRVNLDATSRNSLASGSPTTWSSIAPGSAFTSIAYRGTFAPSATPGSFTSVADSFVSFGHQTAARITGDLTVEMWLKLNSNYVVSSTNQDIASHYFDHSTSGKDANSMDWFLRIVNGRLVLFTSDVSGTETNVQSPAVITSALADKWIQIGFTQLANGTVQFFLNGAPTGSALSANARRGSTTARLLIGNGSSSALGSISKFRMYAEALTSSQIKSNFNLEAAGFSRLEIRDLTIDSGSYSSSYTATATPPTITATASAGTGSISFASSTTAVCTVNSSTGVVAFVTAGTCTVSATIAADSTYDSATSASVSITVTLATRTLSIDSGSYSSTYAATATPPTITSTASAGTGTKTYSSSTTSVCTINSSTGVVAFVTSGTCTLAASIAASTTHASATASSVSFTVSLATQTVTWSPTLSILATASPVTPSALASALGSAAVTYAVQSAGTTGCTVNSSTAVLTFSAPGSCTVRATAGATSTYAAGTVDAIFTITAATLSDPSTPTATATSGTLKSIAVSWTAVTNASSYTLKLYATNGSTLHATITGLSGTSRTITATDYSSLADNTAYKVSITAIGTGNYSSSNESSKASVTTASGYTLTYSYDGATSGNADATSSFVTGATAVTLPVPAKTGYTFDGWYEASDLSGTKLSSTYTPTQTRSLYAKWIANTLVVTYEAQGGTTVTAGSVVTGANLTAPTAPTKAGYTFSGWSTTSTGSVVSFTGGYAHGQTASFTLYAIWAANALTVTYDSKGGASVANGTVNTGASISAAPTAPTKTGYMLSGWSATETGTVVTFPYAHNQTASFTLYAIWTGNTNTITYNSKGGSSVADGSFVTGGTIASAPTAPTRAGYTLSGWSLTDGGSVITYPYSPVATAGITLYAIWSGISCSPTSSTTDGYTIYTFTTAGTCFWTVPNGLTDVEILAVGGGGGGGYAWDNAGAGGGGGGQVKTGTATLSTTLEVTVGAGGTAGVLSSTRGGTGGSTVVSTLTALGGTGGCAARATTCSNSAQATSLAAGNGGVGGSGGASGKGGGGSNTSGSLTSTTTGGTGTASSYSGTSVTYGVGGTGGTARGLITSTNIAGTAGSANTGNGGGGASAKSSSGEVNGGTGGSGLVVVRVASALTITFDSQSGSAVSDGSTLTGASIATAPTDPTRTNYTFVGWFTSTSGGSAISFPYAHGQTANFTLYARWALNTYAITFNANNGSGTMANQAITHGTAVNLNANLYTRANYVFHRWATAADGTGTTYNNLAQVTLTAGTTLYAQWTANTYVVTYSYNNATGGNSTATSSFTTGGTAIVLPTPTRTGYTFAGWFSDAGLSSSIGLAGANYSPAGSTLSLNAYAKWTAVDYTFTYDGNSSDSGSVPTETSKQITQTATVSANTGSLVRAGYTFSGWNTQSNGGGTTYLSGSIFTVQSSNVTLYAKWTANTYTVTYNSNGGTGNAQRTVSSVATNISTDSYTTGGASIALPGVGTLERAGYTFGGWNTSASGTGTNRLEAATYTTVSDVTLYAKWNAVTYSITYDANTGTGTAPTTGGYTTGQASPYSVLNNTFTKTSNVFGGWNTASNGTGTSYSPGATITTLANIVLYATWIPQYTLHYAINGGTVTSGSLPGDQLYNTGTSVGPVFSSVSRTGYTFGGWSNGSTTIASGGSFIIAADSVLTAIWNPINYVISYESDGGSTAPSSITKQIGQSYTVGAAVSKPGYNFAGWSNGSSVVGAGAGIVMGSSDVTYTAQWVAKIYTISYDWNGGRGTAVSDANYTFGTTAITLPLVGDRVKDGYTFAGWSESSNGSALSSTYIPSQSRTLYALWNIGNFTVTYDAGRGTVANSTVAVLNGGSTVLPLPTRANFVFNGWHTAVTGGSIVGSNGASFTPTSSQTIYARWIQSSLYGITDSLSRIGSVVTSSNIANTFSGANSNSSVAVSIPANALPAGTTINFDLVSNSSRATGILSGVNYLVSIALSWLTGDETVPDTASDKPITVTISNSSIKAGAAAYAIVNNVSTLLGTATQDGVITVSITSDPEIVVAATKPTAPTNVAATSNGNQQSVISWSAPSSDGGSAITGYTVTANTGATCTTSTTSCTISSLTNGTAYTFTVTATNTVGTSVASTSASGTTAALYAVTFDSKGGTSVTNGSFLTASTVSEPTAPTRTGYSFAGWSATDGGSAEVFPYAPGVTTNITMYARWDALDNVVTFDSKSGSAVADGVFSSGGTVTQPTAPTRSGYTFAGWSATDGGAVVTFPYAPGVVTDITLYAKWTVVSQNSSSGGGGGSSTPAPSEPSGPVNPVKSNVTVVPPVFVVGDQETKGIAVQITTPSTGSEVKPPAIKLDAASEKFIAEVKVVEGKLVLTPETGFSGKKTVTVTVTENGADRFIQIPLTVLPEPVTKPVLTPTASNKTIIRWTESPNADAYSVYLNGKKICSTEATSCSINRVLGPDADIQIISNGGDRTISTKAEADFKQNVPVQITRLVSATVTKATLTRVDTKALDKVIALIKTQGFGTVVISEITTTSKTKSLAEARIAAIKKYIDAKTGSEKITFEVVPAASRTYFNNISVKG